MTESHPARDPPDPRVAETVSHEPIPHPSRLPDRIGRYHIKRVIASGGMGTVFEATQDNPRRVVAVKVMKQGITSKSALRRFEYEGQILGRLRHPGIAQIYEAGTHSFDQNRDSHGAVPDAVPYFAMEYIPNAKTITKFADEKKLGTRQRMELFAKVCDAIHHGHQKGIIHRDLKPSNILVDSTGQVKIIDFGVARSTDSDMAVTTLQTDVGQLIGTLQYMSPEQCDADPHDIDTRSDVYALGVVFYELLCGKLPYDVTRMAMHHATRVIRDQHPTKLSTLDKTLRGDVETIALKALEKERERRYQSAADFGHDIQRYLTGEAIAARRASIVYQLRLFARRNKAVFASLAALFVILVTATIVSTSFYLRAEAARAQAEKDRAAAEAAQTAETEQRQLAESQRDRAAAAEQEADTRRAQAEAVTGFLRDMLTSIQPARAKGREISVREVLDEAANTVHERLKDEPLVEFLVQRTIADTYTNLGLFKSAIPHWDAAREILNQTYGAGHEQTIQVTCICGDNLYHAGDSEKALEILQGALSAARKSLGEENRVTARVMVLLGNVLRARGRLGEAELLLVKALDVHERLKVSDLERAHSMANLGLLYMDQGRYKEAEDLYRRSLEIDRRERGNEYLLTIRHISELADICARQGKWDEAELLSREAAETGRRVLGSESIDLQEALARHSVALEMLGRYTEAEPLLLDGYSQMKNNPDAPTERVHEALERLVKLYESWDAAEPGKGYAEKAAQWRAKLEETQKTRNAETPKP